MTSKDSQVLRKTRVRFAANALGVMVVGIAGYVGFVAFAGSDRDTGVGVVALGAVTGFAAFFSPCSFPLLLTFLTRKSTESRGAAVLSALRVGIGAAVLLGVVAAVVAGGGTALTSVVAFDSVTGRVFRFIVGATLVAFGLRQARLVRFRMPWLDSVARSAGKTFAPSRAKSAAQGDVLYGFGYLLAGFG